MQARSHSDDWQFSGREIVPEALPRLLAYPDTAVSGRVFAAMIKMVKLDIAALERAASG